MNETNSADFDWVTARKNCSVEEMYEKLRGSARENMLTRNDILDESEDRDRFKMKDRQPRGFTIFDAWANKRARLMLTCKRTVSISPSIWMDTETRISSPR